jgi:hypothetical protein
MRRIRRHLTYANVISTLALFLVLSGGVVYAANTIGSADIIDGEVKNADLGANAVTGAKVFPSSLTGADVAGNSLAGSDIDEATLAGLICPSTMLLHEGVCIEKAKRASATWVSANTTCRQAGRRLPSLEELLTFRLRPGQNMSSTHEHTQLTTIDDGPSAQSVWENLVNSSGLISRQRAPQNVSAPYRCVGNPS